VKILAQKLAPDIGVAGLGKMQIKQVIENQEMSTDNGEEFDIMEDLLVFMRNDPVFYRKKYFPMISNMCDCVKKGTKVDKKNSILPVVKSGYNDYCEKYNIKKKNHQYTKENVLRLINEIYTEEMENIKSGEYD
jgi:hypothetical protein